MGVVETNEMTTISFKSIFYVFVLQNLEIRLVVRKRQENKKKPLLKAS